MAYEGKLSKIMDVRHALAELKEYDVIDSADPSHKYHMGKPDICSPVNDSATIHAVDKCKWIKSKDIAKMKLLLMKDGGLNLADYLQDIKSKTKTEIEMFLIELHRMVLGVHTLSKHGIVHHDLKPQNMVYNEKENRVNFIDFGHMRMIEILKNKSIQSSNTHAVSHWSFPMEMMFQNKREYMKYAKMTVEQRMQLFPQIRNSMKDHTIVFLAYITNMVPKAQALEINVFLKQQFYDFFVNELTPERYNEFIAKSIGTTDLYGLGFSLLHIIGPIRHMLHSMVYEVLSNLCLNAINPKVSDRCDIDFFLQSYETILTDSGILRRNGLQLTKHDIVPIVNPTPAIEETPDEKIPFVMAESLTPCDKSGKERNPKTGRCVKRCKDGYVRNAKFNCAKIKICPENKELNPKTRRCVAKCKDGYTRNANFRCTRKAGYGGSAASFAGVTGVADRTPPAGG